MVRSIGSDRVIDYTKDDFARSGQRYDLFLDCVGNQSLSACRRVLNTRGIYVMVGGTAGRWIDPSVHRLWSQFCMLHSLHFGAPARS